MVNELAAYEREPDAVRATEHDLSSALFEPDPTVFAYIAEDDRTGEIAGFALWFTNFSTWNGTHGVYLEDLYVRPQFRHRGYGKALLAELAAIAVERGYQRVEWAALDWNEPAHRVYRSIGAVPMDEWTTWRLTGDKLARFGRRARGPRGVR